MNHSTKRATKAEKERLDAIHCMPCLACDFEIEQHAKAGKRLTQPFPTEADHLVDKGSRVLSGGHMATIPLDGWHHRGQVLPGHTSSQMAAIYGPSKALNKKAFDERYGGPRILLVETDARIATNRHMDFA